MINKELNDKLFKFFSQLPTIKPSDPTANERYVTRLLLEGDSKVIFDVGAGIDVNRKGETDVGWLNTYNYFVRQKNHEVHFFEPEQKRLDVVKEFDTDDDNTPIPNSKYNAFGLSDKNQTLEWFSGTESFHDRSVHLTKEMKTIKKNLDLLGDLTPPKGVEWASNFEKQIDRIKGTAIPLEVKRADSYIKENNIKHIDFVKIDVEGHEEKVINGFGDSLDIVNSIMFEFGGTWNAAEYENKDDAPDLRRTLLHLQDFGFNHCSFVEPFMIRERSGHRTAVPTEVADLQSIGNPVLSLSNIFVWKA